MRIAVDAMGGDYGPEITVEGCIKAIEDYRVDIVLVGKEARIKEYINLYGYVGDRIKILNADEIISNEDEPVMSIKKKKDSSLVRGLDLLKKGEVDAFISAGNTGALMAGALLKVGRVKGIKRPALAPVIPTLKGGSMLIDAGANTDCNSVNIQQFALMGSIYMKNVMSVNIPVVGLINIGAEENKGNNLTRNSYNVLKNSNINFKGNIEARDILNTDVHVLVCDGFVGNIVLKLIEGTALNIFDVLKKEFTRSVLTKLASIVMKPGLKEFKKSMDYTEYGGAPLMGINGVVIKAHGSSNAKAITNAVRQAKLFLEKDVLKQIREQISDVGDNQYE